MRNKILYLNSLYLESLTYLALVVVHVSIKNMFLHRTPGSINHCCVSDQYLSAVYYEIVLNACARKVSPKKNYTYKLR